MVLLINWKQINKKGQRAAKSYVDKDFHKICSVTFDLPYILNSYSSMKYIHLLSGLTLLIFIALLQSCGGDEVCPDGFSGSDCETHCSEDIFGTWNVTNIQPAFCDLLSYEIGVGSSTSILSISLDDGTRTLTGNGLLDADCSEMTYTVSSGSTILSGAIQFTGNTMEDRSDLGCLITAEKQ